MASALNSTWRILVDHLSRVTVLMKSASIADASSQNELMLEVLDTQ
jgi:hypothetical protein